MARGIALILVAIVLGVVLLRSTDKSPTFTESASTGGRPRTTTPTTTADTAGTTTTTVALAKVHNPAEVTILVANGSGQPGVAAKIASLLKGSNFVLKESTNTKTPATATVVYFAPGYEPDAKAVAALLTPKPVTLPMPSALPVKDLVGAKILVVVAADHAAGR